MASAVLNPMPKISRGKVERVFSVLCNAFVAICFKDFLCIGRADAVGLQKDHDIADRIFVPTSRRGFAPPVFAQALDFKQPFGDFVDDVEGVDIEFIDDACGVFWANAFDEA